MQSDFIRYVVALGAVVVWIVTDLVFWKPRRRTLAPPMRALYIAWGAALFVVYALVMYGFDLPVLLVAAACGLVGSLVAWQLDRPKTRTDESTRRQKCRRPRAGSGVLP